jgi:DNA-binding SARP family transcriptional activator
MRRALQAATHNHITDLTINHDGRYALNPDLVTVDLWQLRHHLNTTHQTNSDQNLTALENIINLYHGDLAEELTAEWLEAPREALRRDLLDHLSNLAHHLTPDNPQKALKILEHARQLDPYNEPIYDDIARTQAQLGHHAAIKHTLTLLTTHLAELNEKPTPHTLTLYQQLLERN